MPTQTNINSLANLKPGMNPGFERFNDDKKVKALKEFQEQNKSCLFCGTKIEFEKRVNNFCNSSCSARFNNSKREAYGEDTKAKISDSVKRYYANHPELIRRLGNCLCGSRLSKSNRSGICRYCWQSSPENREAISKRMKARVAAGLHKGWNGRPSGLRSFAETYVSGALLRAGITDFVQEFKVSKSELGLNDSLSYFLDFYFPSKKLVLEVDGGQHLRPEIKAKDDIRDKALTSNGYTVFRIPWKSINSDSGKQRVLSKIDEFVTVYNSL